MSAAKDLRNNRRSENCRRGRSGFTIAETLVAVLILLMVSSVVAAGIPAAKSAFEKVVVGANAEILLSTSVASLRDQLAARFPHDHVPSPDAFASVKMHVHLFRYFSGRPGAAALRARLNSVRTLAEIRDAVAALGEW